MTISLLSLPRVIQIQVQIELRESRFNAARDAARYVRGVQCGAVSFDSAVDYVLQSIRITPADVQDAIKNVLYLIFIEGGYNAVPKNLQHLIPPYSTTAVERNTAAAQQRYEESL